MINNKLCPFVPYLSRFLSTKTYIIKIRLILVDCSRKNYGLKDCFTRPAAWLSSKASQFTIPGRLLAIPGHGRIMCVRMTSAHALD